MDYWLDKPQRFMENLDERQREELKNQHSIFTGSNGVGLLKDFLISKNKENEMHLQQLVSSCFSDNFIADAKNKGDSKPFAIVIEE